MIILDVPVPKNCTECPCLHHGEYGAFEKSWCAIDGKIMISKTRRPKKCPIHKEIGWWEEVKHD